MNIDKKTAITFLKSKDLGFRKQDIINICDTVKEIYIDNELIETIYTIDTIEYTIEEYLI